MHLVCFYLCKAFWLRFFTIAILFPPHSNSVKKEFVLFQHIRKRIKTQKDQETRPDLRAGK